ncbi:MAG: GGDEF domain-containing protein [Thermodesulfobacteriota bacterium]
MSPHVKLSMVLVPILAGPSVTALAFLETGRQGEAAALLAIHGALSIALLPFISRLALYLSVLRELKEVAAFAYRLRRGGFPAPFELPVEKEDEHILIRLKRSLNWMLHMLKDREKRLLWRLEETGQAMKDLEDLSRTDPLTGLGNRRRFDEAVAGLASKGQGGRLLLMDCDRFKQVNDAHGHQAGDEVLTLLAGIMRDSVRARSDEVFRLGGDEFAVILGCTEDQALEVAGRIRERFKRTNGRGCTLSMGLAACDAAGGAGGLVARADAALYDAKGAGGDTIGLR